MVLNGAQVFARGGGTSIFLTGMLFREQILITQKYRMPQNSNPEK